MAHTDWFISSPTPDLRVYPVRGAIMESVTKQSRQREAAEIVKRRRRNESWTICFVSVEGYGGNEEVEADRWRFSPQTSVTGTRVVVGIFHLNISPIRLI